MIFYNKNNKASLYWNALKLQKKKSNMISFIQKTCQRTFGMQIQIIFWIKLPITYQTNKLLWIFVVFHMNFFILFIVHFTTNRALELFAFCISRIGNIPIRLTCYIIRNWWIYLKGNFSQLTQKKRTGTEILNTFFVF